MSDTARPSTARVAEDDQVLLGPVDFLVVEYPDHHVSAAGLDRVKALADADVIRVLDAELFDADEAGTVVRHDLADTAGAAGAAGGEPVLRWLADACSDLLDDDDLLVLAGTVAPGASCLVVVFESSWTAALDLDLRAGGARLAATGYVDIDDLAAVLELPSQPSQPSH